MEETLSGQKVIIAFDRHAGVISEFSQANQNARISGIKANILAGLLAPLTMILSNLNVAVVVGAGALMAINGVAGVSVGMITAFTDYSRRFGHPLMQIANLFNSIVAALAGSERIFEIIDTQPQIADKKDAVELSHVQGSVAFEQVEFSYNTANPVLKNVSLTAKPGSTIALVGPTGAGKTTIINLLSRFYDVDSGRILIDGHEIRDIGQDSLRRQLGIVLQDTFLFAGTVMENIRYGCLDASDEEVIAAAKLANADGFIQRLPDGYQSQLSERGGNLSQGQRQLLAIARAVLADPSILILDEATSSVDTRTEMQIQNALLKLMEGRTSFVIAHRLSTIRQADLILVVDDGRIIERGTHHDLLQAQGFYHNLYTSQFKGQAVVV
jgi:ATP-binding cassette subfamily B protein